MPARLPAAHGPLPLCAPCAALYLLLQLAWLPHACAAEEAEVVRRQATLPAGRHCCCLATDMQTRCHFQCAVEAVAVQEVEDLLTDKTTTVHAVGGKDGLHACWGANHSKGQAATTKAHTQAARAIQNEADASSLAMLHQEHDGLPPAWRTQHARCSGRCKQEPPSLRRGSGVCPRTLRCKSGVLSLQKLHVVMTEARRPVDAAVASNQARAKLPPVACARVCVCEGMSVCGVAGRMRAAAQGKAVQEKRKDSYMLNVARCRALRRWLTIHAGLRAISCGRGCDSSGPAAGLRRDARHTTSFKVVPLLGQHDHGARRERRCALNARGAQSTAERSNYRTRLWLNIWKGIRATSSADRGCDSVTQKSACGCGLSALWRQKRCGQPLSPACSVLHTAVTLLPVVVRLRLGARVRGGSGSQRNALHVVRVTCHSIYLHDAAQR